MAEPTSRKHYYTDLGNPQFAIRKQDRHLILDLANAIGFDNIKNVNDHSQMRGRILDKVCGVIQSYHIHRDMGDIGSGLTLEQWQNQTDTDPIEQAIKKLMFYMIDNNYLYRELPFLVWDTVCEIQLNYILGE